MLGVLAGDVVLYWAGRRFGGRVLEQPLLRRLVDPARLEQTSAAYRRRGALIVVLARNVVGLRAVAFVAAGVVRLPFWKYLVADVLAVSVGVPLNFGLAYLFTAHLHAILAEIHRVERWLALAALAAGAVALYVALRRRSQRALAQAAAPAPR
jgi:membrane protein DedA with SNARE-associated domain